MAIDNTINNLDKTDPVPLLGIWQGSVPSENEAHSYKLSLQQEKERIQRECMPFLSGLLVVDKNNGDDDASDHFGTEEAYSDNDIAKDLTRRKEIRLVSDVEAGKGKTVNIRFPDGSSFKGVPLDDIGNKKGNIVIENDVVKFKQTDGFPYNSTYTLKWDQSYKYFWD